MDKDKRERTHPFSHTIGFSAPRDWPVAIKLGLGFGLLVLVLGVSGLVSYLYIHKIDRALVQIVEIEDPLVRSVLEMEISASETTRAILAYVREQKSEHLEKIEEAKFERAAAEFNKLVQTDEERLLGQEIAKLYGESRTLGEEIVTLADRRRAAREQFRKRAKEIDNLVDKKHVELMSSVDTNAGIATRKMMDVAGLEEIVDEFSAAIEAYVDRPNPTLRQEIVDAEVDFERFEASYREAGLSAEEQGWLDRIDKKIGEALSAGIQIVAIVDELNGRLDRFEEGLEKFDSILNDKVQPLIHAEAVKAAEDAQASTNTAALMLLVFSTFGLSVACALAWAISQSIVGPVRALARGTEIIGAGTLTHRIDINSNDEFGALAVAFNRMVDNLRRSEEASLRVSEQRIRFITDAVPGLIGYVDAGRRYTFVNRRYEEWYGLPRERIVGKHVHELQGEGDYRKDKTYIDAALEGREVSFEAARRFGDGVMRHYHSHFIPHRDDDGTVLGYFALTTDISDRKEAEVAHEQMHQMQKMEALGQMAGGVAHEFNNLLTVIGGFARTAMKKIGDPERVEQCLHEVLAASDRAAEVSRQMLVFSRGPVGEAMVTTVGRELGGLEQMLKSLLESSIELEIVIGAERSTVEVNPSLFNQAIVNLAINARDAMPEGGKLVIGCDTADVEEEFFSQLQAQTVKPGRYVRTFVRDAGIGIGPETQERIFEPFYSTKESGIGTGLGLSMVLGMVKQSNGYIDLESTVGSGTTFSVYLPICEKEPTSDCAAIIDDVQGEGETILLVEDGAQLRNLAKMTLEDLGYKVLSAADGNVAIDLYDEHGSGVDLLLTDIVMPGLSGIRLADMVAEIRPEMRIVFVTGYAPELSSHLQPLAENCLILRKPFEPAALGRIVRQALDA